MNNGKISIIGGSGFVGTNLCRNLAARQIDFEVLDLVASPEFPEKTKISDVRDLQSLKRELSGDVVINLAAVHVDNATDQEYDQTNVLGAQNVAAACEAVGIERIIFTSSVAVYGFTSEEKSEDGEIAPFNAYGRTKFEAEQKLETWFNNSPNTRTLTIVRPTVIFGEGNRGNVYNLLSRIAGGSFAMIGKGHNRKSMAYVGNVVSFLEYCLDNASSHQVFNYADSPDFEMNDLVLKVREQLNATESRLLRLPLWLGMLIGHIFDLASKASGRKFPISAQRVKKFTESTRVSSEKSRGFGYVAPFSLDEGLRRTIDSEFINPDPSRHIFYTE